MSRWVILDRDGTLIKEKHYLHDPNGVELIDGAAEGLRELARAGYRFVIASNQSGIGRGYYSADDARAVNARAAEMFELRGVHIDGWYFCPHVPGDACDCRKPRTGLVKRAAAELGFCMSDIAAVVGDKESDIALARGLHVMGVLVMTGYGRKEYEHGVRGDANCADMCDAARTILTKEGDAMAARDTEIFRQNIEEHISTAAKMSALEETVCAAAREMLRVLRAGGRIMLCGNGGSAADAQHIAAELSGRYLLERPAIDAQALSCNTSALTAIGNDYGYESVFARQVEAHGRRGDLLIAISTSGNSPNIIAAVRRARELGIYTVSLTGEGGGALRGEVDIAICAPSSNTPRIQEMHILIGHTMCHIVESGLNE